MKSIKQSVNSKIKTAQSRIISKKVLFPIAKRTSLYKGEPELIAPFDIQEGSIILEIGARAGGTTLILAKKVGETGRVISLEPNPNSFKMLNNATKNLSNVKIINAAVSNKVGQADFVIERPFDVLGHLETTNPDINKTKLKVETITIDHLISILDLKHIDYAVIDCEGAELEVLKGASDALKNRSITTLIIEVHNLFNAEIEKLVKEYLESSGYTTRVFLESKDLPLMCATAQN